MLKKIVGFFTSDHKNLTLKKVFFILFGVALFLRFPFFFRDYIDRDESTFIIMAQSWVEGNLPYTQLWDLKPPITFLFFACIIYIFGKSFLAIRFFGTLLVVITALCTYKIGARVASKKVGFWSAIGCVMLQSMFGSVQGVMSEHISIAFFCIGFYVLLSKKQWYWFLLSGLLVGLSIMAKLNMVYPALFIGLFMLYIAFREGPFQKMFVSLSLWALGILLLIALTAWPYYAQNQVETWWQSIFEAPLAYSSSQTNSIFNVLPFCLIVATLLFIGFKAKLLRFDEKNNQLLLVVVLGVVLSFVQAGKINGHYLIQLYPFLLVLLACALVNLKLPPNFKLSPYLFLIVLLLPIEAYLEYGNIAKNKIGKGSFYNGEGIEIPKYLKENQKDTSNILFLEYHIGYWVLGEVPPTKAATHPSNITRDNLYPYMQNTRKTSLEELAYIFEVLQPQLIVTRDSIRFFNKRFSELNGFVKTQLKENYKLEETIGKGLVYQRLE